MKHGKRYTKEYDAWQHMKSRCSNPNDKAYKNYGGRGIKVCDRWMRFLNFLADMGNAPSPEYSLDRYPKNDGNYEPGNVRWATFVQQQRNRTNNVCLTYNGKSQTLTEWASEVKLPINLLRYRIATWGMKEAMTRTKRKYTKLLY